jgi:hypothetical protein
VSLAHNLGLDTTQRLSLNTIKINNVVNLDALKYGIKLLIKVGRNLLHSILFLFVKVICLELLTCITLTTLLKNEYYA